MSGIRVIYKHKLALILADLLNDQQRINFINEQAMILHQGEASLVNSIRDRLSILEGEIETLLVLMKANEEPTPEEKPRATLNVSSVPWIDGPTVGDSTDRER